MRELIKAPGGGDLDSRSDLGADARRRGGPELLRGAFLPRKRRIVIAFKVDVFVKGGVRQCNSQVHRVRHLGSEANFSASSLL